MQAGLKELELELFIRLRNSGKLLWTTADGTDVPVKEMTDEHLNNAVKMIRRKNEELEDTSRDADFWAINADLVGLDFNDIC